MSLAAASEKTSVLLASSGEATGLSVLLLVGGNPVDSGVSGDGLVVGVNKDNLEELEGSVLTNPVRVEDSEVSAASSNTLLSDGSVGSVGLELVDTLVNGLAVNDTLGDGSLAATSSDSDSVNHVALLGLVAAGETGGVDGRLFVRFPGPETRLGRPARPPRRRGTPPTPPSTSLFSSFFGLTISLGGSCGLGYVFY